MAHTAGGDARDPTEEVEEKTMTNTRSKPSTGKAIAIVVVIAIVTAIAVTLVQHLILGKSNTAVTGGIVGGIAGALAYTFIRMKSD